MFNLFLGDDNFADKRVHITHYLYCSYKTVLASSGDEESWEDVR